MMYSEFIELTGYGENYITYEDYTNKIEPVYMNNDIDKREFCKRFESLHRRLVYRIVDGLLISKTLDEKLNFIETKTGYEDIEIQHNELKRIFLNAFSGIYKNKYNK